VKDRLYNSVRNDSHCACTMSRIWGKTTTEMSLEALPKIS